MKSVNVCKSIAVALGLLVISASARADIVSDFYNSMVNKSITWQEARASFESMDPTQQQAIRDYDHAHHTNYTNDFVSGITTTPHLDGNHSEPVTPHLDAPHSIVASTLTPATKIVDNSSHLDSPVTDADQQAAKDKAMIEYVQSQIKNGVDGKNGVTTTNIKLDTAAQARVASNSNHILLNTELAENNTRMIQHNSQSIDTLNNAFSALKDEVNNNQKEANAGISGAMAMSNIPQVMNNQTVAIGAGIGGYEGENALAVGASARVGNSVVVKATVSDDTENDVGYGAGLSVGW
ncbi:YadA-like family protein [Cedecea neteri]|uniref:YadA C-terminal domain-containing protein n=1 Tax=Cedecea neteri TaxID=158822 RepID=UPI000983506E|nr:YadA-like family protein [Cedecea neteri]WPU24617.1 YadA-like family protein [Cedecea neteri]